MASESNAEVRVQTRPYLMCGVGASPFTSYAVQGEQAVIRRLRDTDWINLRGAGIRCNYRLGAIGRLARVPGFSWLGFGDIEIKDTGQKAMIWKNCANVEKLASSLQAIAAGTPLRIDSPAVRPDSSPTSAVGIERAKLHPASAEETRSYQMLLRGTSEGDLLVVRNSELRPGSRSLGVSAKWDASHPAPLSTPSPVMPKLVSWSPDGRHLVTACGAWGTSLWNSHGHLVGCHRPKSSYNRPGLIIWSPDDNGFIFVGCSINSYPSEFYDFNGECVGFCDAGFLPFYAKLADTAHPHDPRVHSPRRPGASSFLCCSLGELFLVEQSWLSAPSVWSKPKHWKDAPRSDALSLQPLGSQEQQVLNYAWHSSGAFLAFTTDGPNGLPTATRIVHWDDRSEIACIAGCSILGWSPRGRFLLLTSSRDAAIHRSAETSPDSLVLWDAHSLTIAPLDSAKPLPQWIERFLRTYTTSSVLTNADGTLSIHQKIVVKDRMTGDTIGELPNRIEDAAWSPVDPRQFATAGGDDEPQSVRIWAC